MYLVLTDMTRSISPLDYMSNGCDSLIVPFHHHTTGLDVIIQQVTTNHWPWW